MFESGLVESTGQLNARKRGATVASIAVQALVLGGLFLAPLLYTATLPPRTSAAELLAPPRAPAAVSVQRTVHVAVAAASAAPSFHYSPPSASRPSISAADTVPETGMGAAIASLSPGTDGSVVSGTGPASMPPVVVRAPTPPSRPVRVSSGALEGRRVGGEAPAYPPMAKAAGIGGTVVIAATISKEGTVEQARIVSGNPLLAGAALAAVRTYRYEPYRVSGQAVAVETTVEVRFVLH